MPDSDTGEYWDCASEDDEGFDLSDAPDEVDWEDGELLQTWIDCDGDHEEFARRVKVAHGSCGGRDVAYTGVDPSGERRECPACMREVEIDPVEDEVEHVKG